MELFKRKVVTDSKFDELYNRGFKLLKLLPFFLLIGIFYQFIALIVIDKLSFFSWSQVISDSVALFFPFLFGVMGATLGLHNIIVDDTKSFIKTTLISFLFFIIFFGVFYYFGLKVIYITFIIGFVYAIFAKTSVYIQVISGVEKKVEKKVESSFGKKNLIAISVVLIVIILFYMLERHNMENLYVENSIGKLEKIEFINDRYVITNDSVIPNNQYTVIKIVKSDEDLSKLQEIFDEN